MKIMERIYEQSIRNREKHSPKEFDRKDVNEFMATILYLLVAIIIFLIPINNITKAFLLLIDIFALIFYLTLLNIAYKKGYFRKYMLY